LAVEPDAGFVVAAVVLFLPDGAVEECVEDVYLGAFSAFCDAFEFV
jgi:hypothetical protein